MSLLSKEGLGTTIQERVVQKGAFRQEPEAPPERVTLAWALAQYGQKKGVDISGIPTGSPGFSFEKINIIATSDSHVLATVVDGGRLCFVRDGEIVLDGWSVWKDDYGFISQDLSTAVVVTSDRSASRDSVYLIDDRGARLVVQGEHNSIQFWGHSADLNRFLFSRKGSFTTSFNTLDTETGEIQQRFRVRGSFSPTRCWASGDLPEVVWIGKRKYDSSIFRNNKLLARRNYEIRSAFASEDLSRVLTFSDLLGATEVLLNGKILKIPFKEQIYSISTKVLFVDDNVTLAVAEFYRDSDDKGQLLILRMEKKGKGFSYGFSEPYDEKVSFRKYKNRLVVGVQRGEDLHRITVPFN
jgi:hypothetical protein